MNIAIRDASHLAFIAILECFGFVMARFVIICIVILASFLRRNTIERAFSESVCGFITVSMSFFSHNSRFKGCRLMNRLLTPIVLGRRQVEARRQNLCKSIPSAFINANDFPVATGTLNVDKNIHECQPQASFIRLRPMSSFRVATNSTRIDFLRCMWISEHASALLLPFALAQTVVYRFLLPFVIFYGHREWNLRASLLQPQNTSSSKSFEWKAAKKSKLETPLHVAQSFSKVDFVVRALTAFSRCWILNSTFQEKNVAQLSKPAIFFRLTLVCGFCYNEWMGFLSSCVYSAGAASRDAANNRTLRAKCFIKQNFFIEFPLFIAFAIAITTERQARRFISSKQRYELFGGESKGCLETPLTLCRIWNYREMQPRCAAGSSGNSREKLQETSWRSGKIRRQPFSRRDSAFKLFANIRYLISAT